MVLWIHRMLILQAKDTRVPQWSSSLNIGFLLKKENEKSTRKKKKNKGITHRQIELNVTSTKLRDSTVSFPSGSA